MAQTMLLLSGVNSEDRHWKIHGLDDVTFLSDRGRVSYDHHVHDCFNIDFIQTGSLECHIGARKYSVHQGNSVLIPPHEVHGGRSLSDEILSLRSVLLTESFVMHVASELGVKSSDGPIHSLIRDNKLSSDVGLIHRIAELHGDVLDIETRLVKVVSSLFFNNFIVIGKDSYREHRAVNTIREYLLAHYAEKISLSELAELVQLNRSYLVRVFKRKIGLSPYNYLTEIRIAKAASLLSQGLPPTEVAGAVGLCDQSHLTRFFKRSKGTTPAVYKRS